MHRGALLARVPKPCRPAFHVGSGPLSLPDFGQVARCRTWWRPHHRRPVAIPVDRGQRGRPPYLTRAALALVLCCATSAAMACTLGPLPDPACTPGAVATTDRSEICGVVGGLTYTRRHRVWVHQGDTMEQYGVPASRRRQYEDDDLVPVAAGGDNADPQNHWPQINNAGAPDGLGYEAKDWLDAFAKRAICELNLPVAEVQAWFMPPADWRDAYRQYRHLGGQNAELRGR